MKIQIPHFPLLTRIALTATTVCAISVLAMLWRELAVVTSSPIVVPALFSVVAMLLVCSAAFFALEYGYRAVAIATAGIVALAVTSTITSWVMHVAPPFNVFLFGAASAQQTFFPTVAARDAALPIALASLAVFLLAINAAPSVMRPLGWATGLILLLAPGLRYAASQVTPLAPLLKLPEPNPSALTLLVWLAVMLFGAALMASRYTSSIADGARTQVNWGARLRATAVVTVVTFTLVLWHTLRAAEILQLQLVAQTAAHTAIAAWREGFNDRVRSTARLSQHWTHLGWKIPDKIFLADSETFMRDYVGIYAIATTDAQGRIIQMARRQIALGMQPLPTDSAVLMDAAKPGFPFDLSDNLADNGLKVARNAIATRTRVRSGPSVAANGIILLQTAVPAFDDNQQVVGALVLAFRRDINDAALLGPVAPDFHLRVFTNGQLTYQRSALDQDVPSWPLPFSATEKIRLNANDYLFELAPSAEVVARNLSWTPVSILLLAWTSLLLLTFALYNERRAYALARDRERILNESLDLICTLDAQGRYVTVNDTAQQLLGYLPKEMVGRHFTDLVHPSDKDLLATQWRDARAGNASPARPIRFIHRNGTVMYLQGNAHWSEKEQFFYCDMRDISIQHALEIAREHAANTLTTGVEQAGCVVYEFLHTTQQIIWVGAIHALTGFTPEELNAAGFAGWMQAIHPDDREHVRNTLQRCLESGQPHTIEYRLRRKDGEYVPVLDRGRHVENAPHTQARMIGALIDLTAIREQENALRRSEERYRTIATQVGAVIIERDTATGRVQVSGPVDQVFGYSKEQIESRLYGPEDTMVHSEDRARANAVVADAERNLSSYYLESRRRHRDGHYIHIATRGIVLAGADGRAERAVLAVTDITERKLAEERLQASEDRFRLAAEQAGQIVYELSYDERAQITSMRFAGAIASLLGYSTEEFNALHSENHLSLFHPDDLPLARNLPVAVVSELGSFQVEHRMRHKDGRYVYVENRAAARLDGNGNLIAIVGMLLDISARKTAEAERQTYTTQLGKLADIARRVSTLRSLPELLDYLARSMRELIGANAAAAIVYDPLLPNGQVAAVSYGDQVGSARGELAPFGSPELHALLAENDKPVRLTSAQTSTDPRWESLSRRDDMVQPLRGWLATSLSTRDGVSLGLLEITDKLSGEFTDSDAQVLSQLAGLASVAIENIRLYATLEERVLARTRELQMSNRELEAFSYSVSHDLRAPLRAIAGFSSILETEYAPKLDPEARRYLQRIGNGVERMASLIDDLLSLARVSRLDIKRESIDLSALCRTIIKRQVERWPTRDLQITIDPRMRVSADPRLVEVALENLVENAIKFTGTRAQSQIHIGKRVVNGKPAFFVQDNGVGFDPKFAANLFGVFQRLHSASEFPGTGVGLATVQRIVQRHQGRVWAESTIDQGAVFFFTFDSEA